MGELRPIDEQRDRLLWIDDKYTFEDDVVRHTSRCWVCDTSLLSGWRVKVAYDPMTGGKMFYICHFHEIDQEVLL